jgi:uncharacterized protein (TIGR03000 family)
VTYSFDVQSAKEFSMSRKRFSLAAPILSAVVLLYMAAPGLGGGGSRGGSGGGSRGGAGAGARTAPSRGGDARRGGWDGRQGDRDRRRRDWDGGWGGPGWGWGDSWWWDPWYPDGYGYGNYPGGYASFYGVPATYPEGPYAGEVPRADSPTQDNQRRGQPLPSVNENAVLIAVRVPANAEIWFDGSKTSQTGQVRLFTTPPLEPGHEYSYEVHARWNESGHDVDRTRKVTVHAGDRIGLNFLMPLGGTAAPSP